MTPPVPLQTIMTSTLGGSCSWLIPYGCLMWKSATEKSQRAFTMNQECSHMVYKFSVYVIFACYFIYPLHYFYFLISGQRQRDRDKVTPFRNALLAFETYIRYLCVACITACVLGTIKCLLFLSGGILSAWIQNAEFDIVISTPASRSPYSGRITLTTFWAING